MPSKYLIESYHLITELLLLFSGCAATLSASLFLTSLGAMERSSLAAWMEWFGLKVTRGKPLTLHNVNLRHRSFI